MTDPMTIAFVVIGARFNTEAWSVVYDHCCDAVGGEIGMVQLFLDAADALEARWADTDITDQFVFAYDVAETFGNLMIKTMAANVRLNPNTSKQNPLGMSADRLAAIHLSELMRKEVRGGADS